MSQHSTNGAISPKEIFTVIKCSQWDWILTQSPTVLKLWGECWRSDPFGNRFSELSTSLTGDNLRKAKKVLIEKGLFDFSPVPDKCKPQKIAGWKIRNLYGSKAHLYRLSNDKTKESLEGNLCTENLDVRTENLDVRTENLDVRTENLGVEAETLTPQPFQNPSLIDSISTNKELKKQEKDPVGDAALAKSPYRELNNKLDQVIQDPRTSVQARESVYGDDATLNATHREVGLIVKGIEALELEDPFSDTQDKQEGSLPTQNTLDIIQEKTDSLQVKIEAPSEDEPESLIEFYKKNLPDERLALVESFGLGNVFGTNLRHLVELSRGESVNRQEILAALAKDCDAIAGHGCTKVLTNLLRMYSVKMFAQTGEDEFVFIKQKCVA